MDEQGVSEYAPMCSPVAMPHAEEGRRWTPPALDRDGTISLHRQIQRILRQAIVSGALGADTMLPPEPDLAKEWGVARVTLRLALRLLWYEGLRKRGKGTWVCAQPPATATR